MTIYMTDSENWEQKDLIEIFAQIRACKGNPVTRLPDSVVHESSNYLIVCESNLKTLK
jgi:hypothetical protein